MKLVQVFSITDSDKKQVQLSIGYSAAQQGFFTYEEDNEIKWNLLRNLDPEIAKTIAGLVNAAYNMGERNAKNRVAAKLGLL